MPTAGSFIGAFGTLPVETASGMLSAASIAGYLRTVVEDRSIREQVDAMARESVSLSRRLFVDQKLIERDLGAGVTRAAVDHRLNEKARGFFADQVRDAYARLLGNPNFVERAGRSVSDSID